ncbi:MAG: NAD-dependent dehydratase [Candidatus Marinimicrobia bacterium]|nr:NAD-dependent dehydratase [Candidatus Neomarinimicrobiota bacterium]|tara:strand:- start:2574 stop:3524 length:951 start_codon:yes stop_codon:yes gene_type:complete
MVGKNRKLRVIVTGGTGFIGSNLCERLLNEGHEILCVDNYFSGKKRNISHLEDDPKFEVIRHDVTFPLYLEADIIFHLACPASPVHYAYDPVQTVKTNVHGAINMLGLAKRLGVPIFQASTSEVYGDPQVHPQSEDYWGHVNPIGLRACYDEGKRCAETLFFDYFRQHQMTIKVARIFNTYGPRMRIDDGRVVSNFIVQALRGEDITVYGDGYQTRSFCFIDDMIEGILKFVFDTNNFPGPMNLGNSKEYSINDLANTVIEMTGTKSKIIYKDLPSDDPQRRKPDISLAKEKLSWSPSTNIEKGIGKTIEYFKDLI